MYCFEHMIDSGLPKGKEWPSDLHRKLAVNLLISNPQINTMDILQDSIKTIFKIPENEIPTLTFDGLLKYGFKLGVYV